MSEKRGENVEKYDILSPWYNHWDLRILQDLNLESIGKFQLSIDILNVGNLISSEWGVRQLPSTTQPLSASLNDPTGASGDNTVSYQFDPALTETFTNDFGLNSRWQMQIGLRYIF